MPSAREVMPDSLLSITIIESNTALVMYDVIFREE